MGAHCEKAGRGQYSDVSNQRTGDGGQRSEGGIRFATAVRVRYGSDMSTVQEIEAAADLLPADKKEELLRFLAVRLRKDRAQPQPRIYSAEEVAAMVAEDEEGFRKFKAGA